MSDADKTESQREDSGTPPLTKSWPRLYGLVLAELAILIIVFYAFSQHYQ